MQLQPYVFFDGRCEEAIAFYQKALGAQVLMLLRNKESPEPHQPGMLPPGSENKVLHATIKVGDSTFSASDGHNSGKPVFEGFAMSLTVPDVPTSQKRFNALAEGGKIQVPLSKTFFSPSFGMVNDRFGVMWMIYVAPAAPPAA